ncbi:hypothetical protein BSK64_17825 [Paenibacillus odorifer]|nr:hypothetical protein BSK64_17825 [Paenibacillus odorifer]
MLLLGKFSLKYEEYTCLYAKQKKIREYIPNYDRVMLKVQNIREDLPNYDHVMIKTQNFRGMFPKNHL